MVQGTDAAIIRPMRKSGIAWSDIIGQARSGITPALMTDAQMTAFGERMAAMMRLLSSVNDIRNRISAASPRLIQEPTDSLNRSTSAGVIPRPMANPSGTRAQTEMTNQ